MSPILRDHVPLDVTKSWMPSASRSLTRVKDATWNADLAVGEAYMDGALTVDGGDIYDFLDLCLANLGWTSGGGLRRLRDPIRRLVQRTTQDIPIPVARANVVCSVTVLRGADASHRFASPSQSHGSPVSTRPEAM
jgi:hypothetical protein